MYYVILCNTLHYTTLYMIMYHTVMQYMYRIYNIDSVMKRDSHGGAELCQAHVVPNWQD